LGVDDLDAFSDQLLTLRRAQRKRGPRPRRDYDPGGVLPPEGMEVVALEPGDRLSIGPTRRPRKALTSWGLTGRCVKVMAPAPFGFARVRFALPETYTRHLFTGTIVAARWDPQAKRFRLVPASGYSETGAYVYAQITRPGIYTAVGLPRDPRVLSALRLLQTLGCASSEFLAQADLLQGLDTNDLDEMHGRLPELDLLELVGVPNGMQKPVPDPRLSDDWPTPRGRWECLGPANVPGRIKALAINPQGGRIIYAGAAGGGVWKSTDAGGSWFPTMCEEPSLAIGGLAIAPADPDVLYAATGEWTGDSERPKTPSGMGGGVFRSSDGAGHWQLCGAIDSTMCTTVAVHPENADRVFVGGNRGLHRSDNGGLTWRTLAEGDSAQPAPAGPVTSVVFAHDKPDLVFAGVHRRGVFRSDDGGEHWHLLDRETNGLPGGEAANAPKIALGRHGIRGSDFVAVKMGDAVYTSVDGGNRFALLAEMPDSAKSMMPWCNLMAVHPENEHLLFAGGTNLHRSDDGGASWAQVGGYGTEVHEDQQFIVFDPAGGNRIYLANDGGVWVSNDGGRQWQTTSRGLVAAQAYDVSVSDGPALRVAASLHDESAHIFDGSSDWTDLGWGEGGSVMFVPGRSDELYADSQWSNLMRFRRRAHGEWEVVEDGPDTALHADQPLAVSRRKPHDVLAIDADRRSLLRHRAGRSPDWPIVLCLPDAKLTCVAIAPSDRRLAYAGDSEGRVWHSGDAGAAWSQLGGAQRLGGAIANIAVSRWDARRFYLGVRIEGAPSMFRGDLSDGSCTLHPLAGIAPTGGQRQVGFDGYAAVLEGRYEDTLLAILENDIAFSFDGGMSWQTAGHGLPNVRLMRGAVRETDWTLYVATHGAGVFRRAL